ncbi:MAG: hypothetical protein Q7V63_05965 [Gammaproteobacteria bacterium]|nr:hypothetical protein [Gammaproteobacteria bacterium]
MLRNMANDPTSLVSAKDQARFKAILITAESTVMTAMVKKVEGPFSSAALADRSSSTSPTLPSDKVASKGADI